jgi:hypothetical protein
MSILETSQDGAALNQDGIALARITYVDKDKRLCSVKTFAGPRHLDNLTKTNVPWLYTDTNPEGDEMGAIPREGSMCFLFCVGGQYYVGMFFKPNSDKLGSVTGNEQTDLLPGDKIISTIGGARVVVRANAVVELFSTDTLRTIYFPRGGILSTLCEAYQFKGDGGYITWKSINRLNETLYQQEYRRDVLRTSILVEERGAVDATTLHRVRVGPGIPGVQGVDIPLFEQTIDILGNRTTALGLSGLLTEEETALGEWTKKNNFGSIHLSEIGDWRIKGPIASYEATALGDITLKNNLVTVSATPTGDWKVEGPVGSASIDKLGVIALKNSLSSATIKADGSVEVVSPGATISISASGEVLLKALNKITLDSKAGVDIKALGPVNIESLGPMSLKALTIGLDGSGGGGAINNVLCFPMTVSQFTGSPLVPFSTTVKVSS